MNTAKEKAFDVAREWRGTAYHDSEESADALVDAIATALKEQDRDTRHACADAILALPWDATGDEYTVDRDGAHDACLNVKTV